MSHFLANGIMHVEKLRLVKETKSEAVISILVTSTVFVAMDCQFMAIFVKRLKTFYSL